MKRKYFKQLTALGLAVIAATTMVFPTLGVKAQDNSSEYSYRYIDANGEFTRKQYEVNKGTYGDVAYPTIDILECHTTETGEKVDIDIVYDYEYKPYGYVMNVQGAELWDYLTRDYTDSQKYDSYGDKITRFPVEIDKEDMTITVYNYTSQYDDTKGSYLEKETVNSVFNIINSKIELIETKENENYNPMTISGELLNVFELSFALKAADGNEFNIINTVELDYIKPSVNGLWESMDYPELNYFKFYSNSKENDIEYGDIELNIDGGYGEFYGTYETDNKTYIDVEATGYNDSLGTSFNERFNIIEIKVVAESWINLDDGMGDYHLEMTLEDSSGTRYMLKQGGSVRYDFVASMGGGISELDYRLEKAGQDWLYQTEDKVVKAVEIAKGNKYKICFDLSSEMGDFSSYIKTFTSYEKRKGLVMPDFVSVVATGEKTSSSAFLYNIQTDITNVLNQEVIDEINSLMNVGVKCEMIVTFETEKITIEEKIGDYIIISTIEPNYMNSFGLDDSWLLYFNCGWGCQYMFYEYYGIDNLIYHKIGNVHFKDYDTKEVLYTQEYISGTDIQKPETEPTKEGYKFIDWYMYEGEHEFKPVFPINWISSGEDIEIYAKWESIKPVVKTFDVHFVNYNTSDPIWTTTLVCNENGNIIDKIEAPELEGKVFLGWYAYDSNNKLYKFDFEETRYNGEQDLVLYAVYEDKITEPETEEPTTEEPTTEEPTTEEPTTEEQTTEEQTTKQETETEEPTTEQETTTEQEPTTEQVPTTEEESTTEEETTGLIEEENTTSKPIIEPETEEVTTELESPTYKTEINDEIKQVDIKSTSEVFKEVLKIMAIVISIGLAGLLGILGILLLIMYWIRRVKILNNINTNEYLEDKYNVVYKTTVKTEGNRLAELFKKNDRVWNIVIPAEVIEQLISNDIRIEFNKSFCKRYNGEQLVVVLQNSDNDNKEYGFVVDSKENVISFTI